MSPPTSYLTLFLAMLICLSYSQPPKVESECTSGIGNNKPVFEEKEILNQFMQSPFEIDITEIHLWYGSQVHFNFGRLFFDSQKWSFRKSNLISDVRIERIPEDGIENKEVLNYLTVFRKLDEAIRKIAPK